MKNIKGNKNKKITVVLSIVFSIIVLVGGTFAFFSGSKSQNNVNLVTADIIDKLNFIGNDTEIREGLVPILAADLEKAYKKSENRCFDDIGQSVCSIYHFTIENTADVAQLINISMHPTANSFTNLYYRLYEVVGNEYNIVNEDSKINEVEVQELKNNVSIASNQTKTYEIVYYVLNMGYDQTSDDAGKNFGAGIRIDSIATGQYKVIDYGDYCWSTELIENTENEYRLTTFHGIDNNKYLDGSLAEENTDYGNIDAKCSPYVSVSEKNGNNLYFVRIPSIVGGKNVTTIGNNLFNALDSMENGIKLNNYQWIKSIIIDEGIATIDADFENYKMPFGFIGTLNFSNYLFDGGVSLSLPSTLRNIQSGSFLAFGGNELILPEGITRINDKTFTSSLFQSVSLPSTLVEVGADAFNGSSKLKTIDFRSDSEGNTSLTTINSDAFSWCDLDYGADNHLIIPSSVTYIDSNAFVHNNNLLFVDYYGETDFNDLDTNGFTYYAPNVKKS